MGDGHSSGWHFGEDIDRLRALAAQGVNKTAAAHALGHTASWAHYWSNKKGIAFVLCHPGHDNGLHPVYADIAAARVRHLMAALRS